MTLSVSLGLSRGAFDETAKSTRVQTKPAGSTQGDRWKLADVLHEIEVARSIPHRAASTDAFPASHLAAPARITNEMAAEVASDPVHPDRGSGWTDKQMVSHSHRGARHGTLGGGATEALKDLVGKRVDDAFSGDGLPSFGLR